MLAFLMKACVAALRKFPDFNASLDGDKLVLKQYFHIGFAADTPNGLVVPVVKDADRKGVLEIAREIGELARRRAKASSGSPTCRADASRSRASAASAAPRSRRSSTRPRSRSSACRAASRSRCGTAASSCRGSCCRCRSPTTIASIDGAARGAVHELPRAAARRHAARDALAVAPRPRRGPRRCGVDRPRAPPDPRDPARAILGGNRGAHVAGARSRTSLDMRPARRTVARAPGARAGMPVCGAVLVESCTGRGRWGSLAHPTTDDAARPPLPLPRVPRTRTANGSAAELAAPPPAVSAPAADAAPADPPAPAADPCDAIASLPEDDGCSGAPLCSARQRAKLACDLRDAMERRYVFFPVKGRLLARDGAPAFDSRAHLDACVAEERAISKEDDPLRFYDRMRRCTAAFEDGHLLFGAPVRLPQVALGFGLRIAEGGRIVIANREKKLVSYLAKVSGLRGIRADPRGRERGAGDRRAARRGMGRGARSPRACELAGRAPRARRRRGHPP